MKYLLHRTAYIVIVLLGIWACNKDVGLVTEVEFTISEQHEDAGFVNEALPTTIGVVPEELLEDYEYSFTYNVVEGAGFFRDGNGNRLDENESIRFDPLSITLVYIGTAAGDHSLKIVAEDSYGFTEETTLNYVISNVPLVWTSNSDVSQVLLTETANISIVLGAEEGIPDTSYERNYRISTGTGTLIDANGSTIMTDTFVAIVPGTYQLTFDPQALGAVTFEFIVRDVNGQQLSTTLDIEVVEELSVIEGIVITPGTLTLGIGDTGQLTADLMPTGSPNTSITWASSDITVATVDGTGVVTGVAAGEVTITASSDQNALVFDTATITVTSSLVPVTGLTVTPASSNLTVGGPAQPLQAQVLPTNADQGVTWSSSDNAVATVGANGSVTAVSAGNAVITATSTANTAVSGSAMITVAAAPIPVTGLTVTPASSNLTVGGPAQPLQAQVLPTNADQGVTWSSSDNGVATVGANGSVTAVSAGNVVITATSTANTAVSGSATITVAAAPIPVTGLTVTPASSNLTVGGPAQPLQAQVLPTNADQGVTWSSSDNGVATVGANGSVTAVSAGNVVITATSTANTAVSGSATITVAAAPIPVTGLTVTPASSNLTVGGPAQPLQAQVLPTNADQGVTWSSSDNGVATVDANGAVTAVSAGNVVITATSTANTAVSGSAMITVAAAPIPVTGLTVTPASSNLTVGGPAQPLQAQVLPTNADQGVTWSSSDNAVATVGANGAVTAVSAGNVVITATSTANTAVSGSATITVRFGKSSCGKFYL